MIEATDLRLGNNLYLNNKVVKVKDIYLSTHNISLKTNLKTYCVNGRPCLDYKPIPLTEEWLINFGFIKYGDYWQISTTNVFELLHKGGNHYNCESLDIVLTELHYIHELQNLYFALIKNELQLKQ